MSSGAKQITYYGAETTVGVAATAWKTLPFTSNGLDASAQTTESTTIKDKRIAAGILVTGVEVAGDIATEFGYGLQDDLLEAAAFNPWADNVLTFGGSTRKTFSVIRGFKDVANYHLFTGCHINQWQLSIPDQGIVTSTFSIMGMGRTASNVVPTGTITPAADVVPLTSLSTGDILLDGTVQDGMCATQLDLTINNNMQIQKCLGKKTNNGIGAILETMVNGSGTITVAWSQKTAEFYEKQFTNTPIGIKYSLADSAGNVYEINLPKVLLSAPLPDGGASDILTTQFSFTVANEAPTVTRIPKE